MEKGIITKEMEAFWGKLIADNLSLNGLPKTLAGWGLPVLIRVIDDNYGDKVPQPWKDYATQLLTSVYLVVNDGSVDEQELQGTIDLCVTIINEKIDIPLVDEDDEAFIFQSTLKFIASFVFKQIRGK